MLRGSDSIAQPMEVSLRKQPRKRDLVAVPVLDSKQVAPGVRKDLGETYVLRAEKGGAREVAVGLGAADELDADAIRTAAAAVAREVQRPGGSLAWPLDAKLSVPLAEQARAVVEGVMLGSYDTGAWKSSTEEKEVEPPKGLVLVTDDQSLKDDVERAGRVAEWANRARDLANAPPNELTPERLTARAKEIARGSKHLKVEALGLAETDKLGMGAFAAVARASHNPAQMIVMRYDPPAAPRQDLVLGLVGKAITFDSGGISLKPAQGMDEMKGDMAGGAAVIESTGAIAELGLPVRVLSVVAATENMIGGHAYRPGDILRAMNGKTIEITNTDAEGRLVLADALSYAREQGASHIVDLATLTGAMEVALGDLYAGVFANDERWLDEVLEAGRASGDHTWPFPLHRRYRRYVDSSFADMKNSSDLRQAGAVLAAAFLKEFAGDGPWAHVDMAGTGFLSRSRGDFLWQRGGTGYGVRLIVELARRIVERHS
jgi:leucyl aminopeptidase